MERGALPGSGGSGSGLPGSGGEGSGIPGSGSEGSGIPGSGGNGSNTPGSDPSGGTTPSRGGSGSGARTGDARMIVAIALVLLASVLVFVVTYRKYRKSQNNG